MFKNPKASFLCGLALFIAAFRGRDLLGRYFPPRMTNFVCFIFLLSSFVFALSAVIKSVKQIKLKEESLIYHLISIVGGTLILIAILFWTFLVLALNFDGFPDRD
jgi:hypothetical protein